MSQNTTAAPIAAETATNIPTHDDPPDAAVDVAVHNPIAVFLTDSNSERNALGLSMTAQQASNLEHIMGRKRAVKNYWPAVFYCVMWGASVIMQSFAITLMPSFFAQKQFSRKFGKEYQRLDEETGEFGPQWEIPAPWRAGLTNGALLGEMAGLFISGTASEKYGYKKTMLAALACMTGLITLQFLASDLKTLQIAQILAGVPWGMFQSLPSSYASDIMPQALRPYLTTYINLCWVFGQLIATGALRGVLFVEGPNAWKIPYALQWIFPLPIVLGVLFSPESPAWLVRRGDIDGARHALLRLTTLNDESFSAANVADLMYETHLHEMSISSSTSYKQCFRGIDFRRTTIACCAWMVQSLCGSALLAYSPTVYEACGLNEEMSFNMTLIQYGIAICGNFVAWWLMGHAGRRQLYLNGCMIQCALLFTIGITAASTSSKAGSWAMAVQFLMFASVYACTVGPVCFSLVAEMSSVGLKTKTIVLARNFYNVGSIAVNTIANFQLTDKPSGWGWHGKAAFFWAGTCILCIIWIYFQLPEPRGRTFRDMDILFEGRVSARNFAKADVAQVAERIAKEKEEAQQAAGGDGVVQGVEMQGRSRRRSRFSLRRLRGTTSRRKDNANAAAVHVERVSTAASVH